MTQTPRRFCARHRVALGPRGCPHCAQQELRAHREEESSFWRQVRWGFIPLLVLAFAYIAWPRRADNLPTLDPEAFRKEIETIESVLYRGDRLTREDRESLSEGLGALTSALQRPPLGAAQRRALAGMSQFLVTTASDAAKDHLDVIDVRHRWQTLRGDYFRDAQWLEHGSTALEVAQRSSESRGVPPDVAAYDESLASIRTELNWARAVVDRLPGNLDDADPGAYDGWHRDKATLADDVEAIRRRFPLKREDVDMAWKRSFFELDHALQNVGGILGPDVHTPTLMPHPSTGQQRVMIAQVAINRAADSIASAPR